MISFISDQHDVVTCFSDIIGSLSSHYSYRKDKKSLKSKLFCNDDLAITAFVFHFMLLTNYTKTGLVSVPYN